MARLAGGGKRRDPARLALSREPDAGAIDLRLGGQEPGGGGRVARQGVDRTGGRRFTGVDAAGLAVAPLVVDEHRDALPQEHRRQIGQVRADRRARAGDESDGGMLARPGWERERPGEGDGAAAETHLELTEPQALRRHAVDPGGRRGEGGCPRRR